METLNLPEDCVIAIEVQVVPSETERCEICGRPMLNEAGKPIGIGKERVLAFPAWNAATKNCCGNTAG